MENGEDPKKQAFAGLKLLAALLLVLFNIYHISTEQVAKSNKEHIDKLGLKIEALRLQTQKLQQDVDGELLRFVKSKEDFELFYDRYKEAKDAGKLNETIHLRSNCPCVRSLAGRCIYQEQAVFRTSIGR